MSEVRKAETVTAEPKRAFRLWFGLLGPPLAWAAQFQTVYLGSEWACYARDFTWNHAASVIALIIGAAAMWLAYREWLGAGPVTNDVGPGQDARRRFMALLGLLMGGLFILLMVATWMPTLTGVPCGK